MSISYRVNNLRRIQSMPHIQLRPLTILVGRNSAGKSTFLRSLPLLRQSIETKASAPILWYGDYVDFGNFESAANNHAKEGIISFDFSLHDFTYEANDYSYDPASIRSRSRRNVEISKLKISHGIQQVSKATQRAFIEVSTSSVSATLSVKFDKDPYQPSSVYIDDFPLFSLASNYFSLCDYSSLFENISFLKKDSKNEKFADPIRRPEFFYVLVKNALRAHIKRNLSDATISFEARRILNFNEITPKEVDILSRSSTVAIKNIYKSIREGRNQDFLRKIQYICQARHLFEAYAYASYHLKNYFSQVEYIGPARARSERYYRVQELQVSDISPDGTNLPIFLASLSTMEMREFSDWVESKFDYGVNVTKTESHITINLTQGGRQINVIDTGYGVSQVLPVLAQIWWMQQLGRRFRRDRAALILPCSLLSSRSYIYIQLIKRCSLTFSWILFRQETPKKNLSRSLSKPIAKH